MNTSTQKTAKNIFTFFSNGQNVKSIKNQAKKEHKAGKYSSRSSALNSISKSICKKPFNKAVSDFELISPYTVGDTLYLPLFNDGKKYIVTVNKEGLKIDGDFKIDFSDHIVGISFNKVEYKNLEQVKGGWIVNLKMDSHNSDDKSFFEVKTTDEGIVADLWYAENISNEEKYDDTVLDSTYAFYDEILVMFPSHSLIDFKINKKISDMMASIQLNHKTIDESTTIAKYDNNALLLCGCVKILTPEGQYLYGQNVLTLVKDGVCTKAELMDWMENNAQVKALEDYEMVNNPWFTIVDEDGNPVVECFDSIPEVEFDLFNAMNPNKIKINTPKQYIDAQHELERIGLAFAQGNDLDEDADREKSLSDAMDASPFELNPDTGKVQNKGDYWKENH